MKYSTLTKEEIRAHILSIQRTIEFLKTKQSEFYEELGRRTAQELMEKTRTEEINNYSLS